MFICLNQRALVELDINDLTTKEQYEFVMLLQKVKINVPGYLTDTVKPNPTVTAPPYQCLTEGSPVEPSLRNQVLDLVFQLRQIIKKI